MIINIRAHVQLLYLSQKKAEFVCCVVCMQKKNLAVFCSFRMVGPDTRTHTSFEPRKIKKKIDRQEQQLLILLQQTFHLWQSTSSGYSLYLFSYKNLRRKH